MGTQPTLSRRGHWGGGPPIAPPGQGVTFVELFFDLVFVFAVTEVTGLLHADLTGEGVVQFVIVFWLIWWGWTQFTWALNTADTTDRRIQLIVLVAVVCAFAMATGVGRSYDGSALWFILPYVSLRAVGLGVYFWIASADAAHRAAVVQFAAISALGLTVAVVGGAFEPRARTAVWAVVVLVDLAAAGAAGRRGMWYLHPAHFAERHGLIVIIALGESLIAAAGPVAHGDRSVRLVAAATAAVVLMSAMWWSYFSHTKPALEDALAGCDGRDRSALARDAYSLLHFPVLCGVVAIAVALEEALAHPGDSLPARTVAALAIGLALFAGGIALVHLRATGGWLGARLVIVALTVVGIVTTGGLGPSVPLAVAVAGLLGIAVAEERRAARASR